MNYSSVMTKDAAYFATQGGVQLGIYARSPFEQKALICCHSSKEDGVTKEIFLKEKNGDDLIMQIKYARFEPEEKNNSLASIFGINGKLLYGPKKINILNRHLISMSPNK